MNPFLFNEIVVEHLGQCLAHNRHAFHSFEMYTVTYNVLELMSQASGGKVTTFKDLKIE